MRFVADLFTVEQLYVIIMAKTLSPLTHPALIATKSAWRNIWFSHNKPVSPLPVLELYRRVSVVANQTILSFNQSKTFSVSLACKESFLRDPQEPCMCVCAVTSWKPSVLTLSPRAICMSYQWVSLTSNYCQRVKFSTFVLLSHMAIQTQPNCMGWLF